MIDLRVTPNASQDRAEGVVVQSDGRPVLKLRVRAIPDKGKANAAVTKLLAKSWSVPRSHLSIIAGQKDRNKTVLLAGESETQMALLQAWFDTLRD